jgi:phytoene synthase
MSADERRKDRLDADLRSCRAVTRKYAKSFFFASHVLPAEKRDASYAVYAFCRRADNLVDEVRSGESREAVRAQLEELRSMLESAYATDTVFADPELRAFSHTVRTMNIPIDYFSDLLKGVEMDLKITRYETFEELQVYCYRVASVVGLIMAHIMGAVSPEALQRAADLGTAMQLTNILRDIGEDARRGRIYLPLADLRRFGVEERELTAGRMTPSMRALLAFQIDRSRTYYERASWGIPLLPDDGSRFCVRLMSELYSGILDEIEKIDYDVFAGRAYVSYFSKFVITARLIRRHGVRRRRHGGGKSSKPGDTNTRAAGSAAGAAEQVNHLPARTADERGIRANSI